MAQVRSPLARGEYTIRPLSSESLQPIFFTQREQKVAPETTDLLLSFSSLKDIQDSLEKLSQDKTVFCEPADLDCQRVFRLTNLMIYLFEMMHWLNQNKYTNFELGIGCTKTRYVLAGIAGSIPVNEYVIEWHTLSLIDMDCLKIQSKEIKGKLSQVTEAFSLCSKLYNTLKDSVEHATPSKVTSLVKNTLYSKTAFSSQEPKMFAQFNKIIEKIDVDLKALNEKLILSQYKRKK